MTPVLTDLPWLPAPGAAAGQRFHECARYQLGAVARVLCTRASNGLAVLLDMPATQFDNAEEPSAADDSYVVEPDVPTGGDELIALVADYVQQVALHQRVPITVALLDDLLDASPL